MTTFVLCFRTIFVGRRKSAARTDCQAKKIVDKFAAPQLLSSFPSSAITSSTSTTPKFARLLPPPLRLCHRRKTEKISLGRHFHILEIWSMLGVMNLRLWGIRRCCSADQISFQGIVYMPRLEEELWYETSSLASSDNGFFATRYSGRGGFVWQTVVPYFIQYYDEVLMSSENKTAAKKVNKRVLPSTNLFL